MPYRTLILEDDESARKLLSMVLSSRGHQVLSYESPLRCPHFNLSTCRCTKDRPCFDFLISDNRMPGMTGLEFLEIQVQRGCRLDSRHKALISGCLRDEEISTAARLNCRVFDKPIDWKAFSQWLDEGELSIAGSAG